jgi:lysophospholipase L1-like esterase
MASLNDDGRFDRATRWPCVMAAALGPGWDVIEEGLPGRTTVHDDPIEGAHRNGLTVLPAIVQSHRPIDVAILMLGTNDLKQRFSLTGYDVARGAHRLAEAMQASGYVRRILWVCPPPVIETGCLAEMFTGAEARGATIALWSATLAGELGVGFLDAGTLIAVDPLDGVHLNPTAHEALGRAIAGKVRELCQDIN